MTSPLRWITALAAVLVWIYVGASAGRVLVPVYERMADSRAGNLDQAMGEPLAWLLGCALLLGCAIAWRIVRAAPLDADARSYRSSLSVWPGWPLAIVGAVLAAALILPVGLTPGAILSLSVRSLDDYAFAVVPLALAAAAGATGGRGSQAAAFLAAPTVLLASIGLIGEASIVASAVSVLVAWIVLAAAFAVLALITGRSLLMWLAIGFAALAVIALPLATGLLTPAEVLAAICVLAVGIGLLLYTLVDGAFPWRLFTVGAVEVLAISAAWVLAGLVALLLRSYGAPALAQELAAIMPQAGTGAAIVGIMLVASILLTPIVAAAVVIPILAPILAGIPVSSVLLTLAGLSAMCLRAVHWKSEPEAASEVRLSPAAGVTATAILLAVAALTIVSWDWIVLMIN